LDALIQVVEEQYDFSFKSVRERKQNALNQLINDIEQKTFRASNGM